MPEITVTHIALLASALIIGVILGWIVRGNRTAGEKTAINAGWQEQLEAQRNEHERLMEQNKSLMDQIAVTQRDQLQSDIANRVSKADNESVSIKDRDDKIFNLSRELENWQDKLPPLIERYQKRNAEAEALEEELGIAQDRIIALESMLSSDETRVEPVDPEAMTDGLDASNDPVEETSSVEVEIDEAETQEDVDKLLNGDARDNLKLIKGVGPAIEKTLNEMGILRFSQIADMSEYDIDRIAHRMKGFRSRIYREDWIGQARDLHDQKTSD